MAVPMIWLSKIAAPLVWLLDNSSALVFRLLGLKRESEDRVTAEELHLIVAEASKSGVIEESERAIISGVVRLADRPVREVMTPRKDVDRSEEHTSELQSLMRNSYAVFCFQKKKTLNRQTPVIKARQWIKKNIFKQYAYTKYT